MWLPVLLQWSLGGFSNSGVVILWSFLSPLGAIIFHNLKKANLWFVAFGVLFLVSVFSDTWWAGWAEEPPHWQKLLFFGMNIGAVSFVLFAALIYFLEQLKNSNQSLGDKSAQLEVLAGKLAKYLSPQVYKSIFSGKQDVKLQTDRKRLSIFFSDIVGFTEMTDRMESESLADLLNDYFNAMAEIALRHGGTIDKFIGDAIMIFFGDPESRGEKEDALACVRMAIEMRERMKTLCHKWEHEWGLKPLRIRCGINTGYCTVGNFGSEDRLDYTIVGGEVNLASRLESSADSGEILISQGTFALVKEVIPCEKKGDIQIRGMAYPVQTYQVIDIVDSRSRDAGALDRGIDRCLDVFGEEPLSPSDRRYILEGLARGLKK